MSFRTTRVLVMAPFYLLFQYFLVKYILSIFLEVPFCLLLAIIIILGIFNVSPVFFESKRSNRITRAFSKINYVWMGASVFFFFDILLIYLTGINRISHLSAVLLAVPVILSIYNYLKAHDFVIKEKTLFVPNLKEDVTIAHVSDIHFGSVRHSELILALKEELLKASSKADMVIISGDLADGSCMVDEDDFMPLSEIDVPIIFTPGNHDFYCGIENVLRAVRKAGIIVLDDESIEINGLNIYGLTYRIHNSKVDFSKLETKSELTNVLIYHVPYFWDEFSKIFDVQLSGHTHGGQFYPAVWVCEVLFRYNIGLFENDNKYIHVSTGFGTMDPPFRWGTDAEVVLIHLNRSN